MSRDNDIHPTAIVDGDVVLGAGNRVGAYAVLHGPLEMGDDNEIGAHAVIGVRGDELRDRRYDASAKRIRMGSRCIVREHATVHKAVYGEETVLGDDVYVMHGGYVAHDTIVADGAVLAQNAVIGGVSRVLDYGYLAMGAVLHQETVLGGYAIVAAGAAAVRHVRPFARYIPGQATTVNAYAVERYGFAEHREEIERYVLAGEAPSSDRVGAIVAAYEAQRDASNRRGEH
jgi:UDP-N-acetylglucosamine acyltransferase